MLNSDNKKIQLDYKFSRAYNTFMGSIGKYFTKKIKIFGIVQGVGFRPFVYKIARELNIFGYVLNDSEGVKVHLQCQDKELEMFHKKLMEQAPPRSIIKKIEFEDYYNSQKFTEFKIEFSDNTSSRITQISPDLDVCDDCLDELFNSNNSRYLYPFINCTNCGPRFTITQELPYDRKNTTMSKFRMCPSCESEYNNPENRRFHAQPNGCHDCGPQLELMDNNNSILSGNNPDVVQRIFDKIVDLLDNGKIIAIKGIGGFHLTCNALDEIAVKNLRQRKYREDKPFALMFANTIEVQKYCELTDFDKKMLTDFKHPIVLLKKKKSINIAYSVAPNNKYLGVMLPYSPIHYILMKYYKKPLVMTSGNISDEPVKYSNETALQKLSKIADYFLINDREINIRCDDSVIRNYKNNEYLIRRSRGYAPSDLNINYEVTKNILACGAEQKNVFAVAKDDNIYLSHHIGDLKNYEVLKSFESGIEHFKNIFDINPQIIAVDKHSDYLSTNFGKNYAKKNNLQLVEVQHHHAHAVACMVENEVSETVIALVLDGTGYGNDGNIWGGECLICDYKSFERVGHFREVKMPGGDSAIENIENMGIAYLYEIFGEDLQKMDLPFLHNLENKNLIIQMLEKNISSPITTSCGRLFDGVAGICGFKNKVNYEGQAAIEFEQQINNCVDDFYNFKIVERDEKFILDWEEMIFQLINDIKLDKSISIISEKFHQGLVNGLHELLKKVRIKFNINKVVLSGGVFMNMFLLKKLENKLINDNFIVFTHKKVPTNDGGIALGQIVIAENINSV